MKFTNPDKIYFPKDKITKAEVFRYYKTIAPHLLKYLKNRPLTIVRAPDGVSNQTFVQKKVPEGSLSYLRSVKMKKSDGTSIEQISISSRKALEYLLQLGTVEFHRQTSKKPQLNNPDQMIFDLDASRKNFGSVREVAFLIKDLFDQFDIETYPLLTDLKVYISLFPSKLIPLMKQYITF